MRMRPAGDSPSSRPAEAAKVPLPLSERKRLELAEMIGPYLAGEVNG
jgi:hypothetical protein